MHSAQLLPLPCPQTATQIISINSEGLADGLECERSLRIAVGNPRLNFGEPPPFDDAIARCAILKTLQGTHENRQHQLLGAVKTWVLPARTCPPLRRSHDVRRYRFSVSAVP
jgi:hypothetical protein